MNTFYADLVTKYPLKLFMKRSQDRTGYTLYAVSKKNKVTNDIIRTLLRMRERRLQLQ